MPFMYAPAQPCVAPLSGFSADKLNATHAFGPSSLPQGALLARASGGSSLGLGPTMVVASAHQSRFDFNPLTTAYNGLLLEAQSTNLLLNSEPTIATCTPVNAATLTNQSLSIWGRFAGLQIAGAALVNSGIRTTGVVITNGVPYSFSVWYKAGTSGKIRCGLTSQALVAGTVGAPVSIFTGASVTLSAITTTAYANGVYKTTAVIQLPGTGSTTVQAEVTPNSTVSGENIILLALQLEQSSAPTSYIPTNGSAVTRVADSLTLTLPGPTSQLEVIFDNNTTQTLTPSGEAYTLPTLNRPCVKTMKAQ